MRPSAPLPRLHVLSDDARIERDDFATVGAGILDRFAGRVGFHVRGPAADGRTIFEQTARIADAAGTDGLFVNDRVDVALSLGTSVHLARRSMTATATRRLLKHAAWVGQSAGVLEDLDSAADYSFVGPVYETRSHPGAPGRGIDWLETVARHATIPVMGIGGISPDRIGVLLDAGAYGVAVIRAVWEAPHPLRAVEELLDRLERP